MEDVVATARTVLGADVRVLRILHLPSEVSFPGGGAVAYLAEVEALIDGVDSWNGVMGKGDQASLNNLSKHFDGSMTVKLKDENPRSSKTISTVTISTGKVAPEVFRTLGAHCELWFNVKG